MSNRQRRSFLAVAGTVVLLALVLAGCGRRLLPAGGQAAAGAEGGPGASSIAATPAATSGASEPSASVAASEPPTASDAPIASPQPSRAPLATPNLSQIQALLDDLDAALGADATADTDEGSPQ
jgi:hypothetical protein